MHRGQHVRILFTVTLVWQAIHLGKGREKEEHEKDMENVNATAQKQQPKNEGTVIHTLSDMNQSYESRKQQQTFVPFTGITESKKLNRHCCQNGGTCILGTFCACQKHFTGRYCEYDERKSNCGSIAHGAWVLRGCQLCRCGYGTLHCLSDITHSNCGAKDLIGLALLNESSLTAPELSFRGSKGARENQLFTPHLDLKAEEEEMPRLYSNGLRLEQTVFAFFCLLPFLLELCCWQL